MIECLDAGSDGGSRYTLRADYGCVSSLGTRDTNFGKISQDKLKECLVPHQHLEICDDDYLERLVEINVTEYLYRRANGIELPGVFMEYRDDDELEAKYAGFFHFVSSLGNGDRDILDLCDFRYTAKVGNAIDMGGPLKNFYDSLINFQLSRNTIFVKEGNKIGINEELHSIMEPSANTTIGHMSLYAMIGGYVKGLGDFNSHFKYSHAMHLVYRYRHDYLHSYNIMKIGGVNRKETYLNVLKRFAIHFLNEDMDMVKELPRNSNRLHVYAFLFAEYMDFDKNMDETTHCANVKLHNNSEGTEMETEYKFVFKGTGDTEEEDLFDEAMDFILDYEDEEGKELLM